MSDLKLTPRDMEIVSKAFQCFQSAEAIKIDTEKLAQLAGFANGKSANASWLLVKKKLMGGASLDTANTVTTPKKPKGKAAANGDADEDEEATPTVAAPKKRGKAIKTEPADVEGGDADTEKTPSAEPPKKARAKKTTTAPKTDVSGNDADDTLATETTTPTPKRKRGPNKPKDPNATPAKRAKKGANASATTAKANNNDDAALHAGDTIAQTAEGGSMFGGDAMVKNEDAAEEGAEDQNMANDAMLDTYTEDQVA